MARKDTTGMVEFGTDPILRTARLNVNLQIFARACLLERLSRAPTYKLFS
jgi:hypothetical protein